MDHDSISGKHIFVVFIVYIFLILFYFNAILMKFKVFSIDARNEGQVFNIDARNEGRGF
jgi:hypothetical protein